MIEEVGRLNGEELLRASALDRLSEHVRNDPDLGEGEFTRRDAMARWGWNDNKAGRELERLVKAKILEKGHRYDPRTKRRVTGYWFADEKF